MIFTDALVDYYYYENNSDENVSKYDQFKWITFVSVRMNDW